MRPELSWSTTVCRPIFNRICSSWCGNNTPSQFSTKSAEIYLRLGGWVGNYSNAPTLLEGAEAGTNAEVLETKLSLNYHSGW